MFQVEPNLWLQSFASPWLTALMLAVSFLGYEWLYSALIITAAFGIRLRPALGVMLALLIASLATQAIKDGFGLPRPTDVDARVLRKGQPHVPLVANAAAKQMFALPDTQAIAAVRRSDSRDFGFISGHTSTATALCIALLLCFSIHSRLWIVLLCCWPLLMALSRMYLGRHFLGDVLGGLLVGLLAALVAWLVLPANRKPMTKCRGLLVLLAGVSTITLLCIFSQWMDTALVGNLIGYALVLALLRVRGWPDDTASIWARAGRVVIAFATYALIHTGVEYLYAKFNWDSHSIAGLVLVSLCTAALFLGCIAACRKLRLYRPGTGN
jgi:membrane-associated phospholipid phosphatase